MQRSWLVEKTCLVTRGPRRFRSVDDRQVEYGRVGLTLALSRGVCSWKSSDAN